MTKKNLLFLILFMHCQLFGMRQCSRPKPVRRANSETITETHYIVSQIIKLLEEQKKISFIHQEQRMAFIHAMRLETHELTIMKLSHEVKNATGSLDSSSGPQQALEEFIVSKRMHFKEDETSPGVVTQLKQDSAPIDLNNQSEQLPFEMD